MDLMQRFRAATGRVRAAFFALRNDPGEAEAVRAELGSEITRLSGEVDRHVGDKRTMALTQEALADELEVQPPIRDSANEVEPDGPSYPSPEASPAPTDPPDSGAEEPLPEETE